MNYIEENDTIAALATGKGNAALAVIRISGNESIEKISRCLTQKEKFLKSSNNSIHLYQMYDSETKKPIDDITAIKYISPKSYTGENMVEIISHGGEIIIDEIMSNIFKTGIRFAKRGEFTRRAYLNGKMDLLKTESIQQIIDSRNRHELYSAIEMYQGNSKKKLFEWKDIIVSILAEIEAIIEFPEEDDTRFAENKKGYKNKIESLYAEIKEEIRKIEQLKIINQGILLPIVGIANAGKSSLFNLLLGFERSIVHHEEGTTRDAVSEEILLNGEKIKIIDTAGINKTDNQIEIMGIKKSWEFIGCSDLIVLVTPSNQEIKKEEIEILEKAGKERIIIILSKSDVDEGTKKKTVLNKIGIPFINACLIKENEREKVLEFISERIKGAYHIQYKEPGIIFNKRQEEIIFRINKKIKKIFENIEKTEEEIISLELKGILFDLDEFVGETNDEQILDSIFSSFCIGK